VALTVHANVNIVADEIVVLVEIERVHDVVAHIAECQIVEDQCRVYWPMLYVDTDGAGAVIALMVSIVDAVRWTIRTMLAAQLDAYAQMERRDNVLTANFPLAGPTTWSLPCDVSLLPVKPNCPWQEPI
jgi:hypothetical protein